MARYLVTYDLHKIRNYPLLLGALQRLHAVSPAESVWLLEAAGPADQLVRALRTTTDGDDGLFAFNMDNPTDWAVRNGNDATINWMIARYGGQRG